MVGVRHIVHDEADDRFMLGGNFLHGMTQLKAYDLCYDLLLFPRHLPIAIDVVKQFPRQRFVLDHIAKPFIKDGILEPWASDIRQLASFENVWCKVSGMVTEAVLGRLDAGRFSTLSRCRLRLLRRAALDVRQRLARLHARRQL